MGAIKSCLPFHSIRSIGKRCNLTGTPKLFFLHYSCLVIILSDTDLYKSTFSVYSFKKLVFRLSVFCVFAYCFKPLMPGGNKKGYTNLNKPEAERSAFSCVCLSMCDLFVTTRH